MYVFFLSLFCIFCCISVVVVEHHFVLQIFIYLDDEWSFQRTYVRVKRNHFEQRPFSRCAVYNARMYCTYKRNIIGSYGWSLLKCIYGSIKATLLNVFKWFSSQKYLFGTEWFFRLHTIDPIQICWKIVHNNKKYLEWNNLRR